MTSSSMIGQADIKNNTIASPDIQSNSAEAMRLYQRGVAAARGGQRRIAAGLLTRSVQLDPHNESAWLWLSGVLDDPHQIAFCLHTVLKLNPVNERARQGLIWLEERQLLKTTPKPTPLMEVQVDEPPARRKARESGESWWVNWRQMRRDMSRVRMLLWSVPVVLLFLSLLLHEAFVLAVQQQNATAMTPANLVVVEDVAPPTAPPTSPVKAVAPVVETEPVAMRQMRIINYVNAMEPIRQQLRDAVEHYRDTTGKPGSALSHVASARALRTTVERAHVSMEGMVPPPSLQQAHALYMEGLRIELAAIDDLLEFYSTYRVESANRAVLGFQEASIYFDQAGNQFAQQLEQVAESSAISPHTIR